MRYRTFISLVFVVMATSARAGDLQSASYTLRGAHTNAGSNGLLQPSGPPGNVGSAGATVGSGISHGDSNGQTLGVAAGFWMVKSAIAAAGSDGDFDGDGVPDAVDNCIEHANPTQLDSNLDGYGNACDFDVDDDGGTSLLDLSEVMAASRNPQSADPVYDFDGDGGVSLLDVSAVMQAAKDTARPGPSGLDCAGDPLAMPCTAGF
jgi:hypothetical protein